MSKTNTHTPFSSTYRLSQMWCDHTWKCAAVQAVSKGSRENCACGRRSVYSPRSVSYELHHAAEVLVQVLLSSYELRRHSAASIFVSPDLVVRTENVMTSSVALEEDPIFSSSNLFSTFHQMRLASVDQWRGCQIVRCDERENERERERVRKKRRQKSE